MKTKGLKRVGAVIIALATMVVSLGLQTSMVNADTKAADVTVYFTMVVEGDFAVSNGKEVIQQPVIVKDIDADGKLTIEEAFIAAHDKYCAEKAAGFSSPGGWISKIWNVDTINACYYVNNVSVGNTSGTHELIADGDYLNAYILKDTSTWSDVYSYFNANEMSVDAGKTLQFSLTQNAWGTDSPAKNVNIKVIDEDGKIVGQPYTTDDKGNVEIKFDKAGIYTVMSYADDGLVVPNVCKVTVKAAEEVKKPGVTTENNDKEDKKTTEATTEKSPNTGDGTEAIMWIITLVGASACLVGLKRKEDK